MNRLQRILLEWNADQELLLDWFQQPGSAFADADRDALRVRLAWALSLEQDVWDVDARGQPQGWAAWVRTDARGLDLLRRHDLDALVGGLWFFRTHAGPHVYVVDLAVAPWAEAGCYRRLYRLVRAANQGAATISGHQCKRDGRRLWHQRRIDGGLVLGTADNTAARPLLEMTA